MFEDWWYFYGSVGVGGPDHWAPQPQVSSSLESSTSSQEHLNFSTSSSSSNKTQNQKTGPGRWKTPNAPHPVPPHPAQTPSRSDLPPPPPPPPATYLDPYDPYDPQPELPLPPPPAAITPVAAQQAADRKKREEQQRWYEKEKARLEEERWGYIIFYLMHQNSFSGIINCSPHSCLCHDFFPSIFNKIDDDGFQGKKEERAGEEAGSNPGQSCHARPTSQQRRIHASPSPPAPSCLCGPASTIHPPTASASASPAQTRETGEPASVSCSSPCQYVQPSRWGVKMCQYKMSYCQTTTKCWL